jgi:hypothetical protein
MLSQRLNGFRPAFEICHFTYLAVKEGDVLDVRMLNDILNTRVLSDTAHADTMGVVAPEVLHEDV